MKDAGWLVCSQLSLSLMPPSQFLSLSLCVTGTTYFMDNQDSVEVIWCYFLIKEL